MNKQSGEVFGKVQLQLYMIYPIGLPIHHTHTIRLYLPVCAHMVIKAAKIRRAVPKQIPN